MMTHRNTDSATRNRFRLVVLGLTLFGGALRFYGLGFRDFWFDESCTFIYVKHLFDWPEGSSLLTESTNLPYYVLLRGWVELWGASEISYRAFSALAATLTIPLIALLARRLTGPFTALVCALLVAVHPLHIHYAHEARAYTLWIMLLTILLWSLHIAATTGRKRWWLLYGLLMLSCLHLHYFSIYLFPATVGVIFLAGDRKRAFRCWMVTSCLVGLAFVPYFMLAVWPAARAGGGVWIAEYFQPLSSVFHSLWAFLPAGAYPLHLRGLSLLSVDTVKFQSDFLIATNGIARALPAVLVIAMIALLTLRGIRNRAAEATNHRAWTLHAFMAAVTLGPLLLAWLYAVAIRPNYLVARYDLVSWPAFIVWLSIIITSFTRACVPNRPRMVALLVTGLLGVCSIVPIVRMAALRPPPTPHHERAKFLAEETHLGDLVIALSYDRDYLLYYLHRYEFAGRIVSFPSWLDGQIGWVDTEADLASAKDGTLDRDARILADSAHLVLDHNGKVYLLLDWLDPNGTGERGPIYQVLTNALTEAGLRSTLASERLYVLRLQRTQ